MKVRGAQVSSALVVALCVSFLVVMMRTAPSIGKAATLCYHLFFGRNDLKSEGLFAVIAGRKSRPRNVNRWWVNVLASLPLRSLHHAVIL